jgi:hypothetical protein
MLNYIRVYARIHRYNEEVLHRVNEERNIPHAIKRRKANWIGHTELPSTTRY